MKRRWDEDNMEALERDLFYAFCEAVSILDEQFLRLKESGTVSYSTLAGLVGEPSQKGLLWWIKDSAHNLLRDAPSTTPHGAMLDWSLGYIFHESIKLMEDSRLRQSYVPRVAEFAGIWPKGHEGTLEQFGKIEGQTERSTILEAARLQKLIDLSLDLFCGYFLDRPRHRPLARLLFDQKKFVQRVFKDKFEAFIESVYGEYPDILYLEAARSLLNAGRIERAEEALNEVKSTDKHRMEVQDIRNLIRQTLKSGSDNIDSTEL